MIKTLIVYLLLMFATSHAQQATMICTPHLNEIKRFAPQGYIFQKGNNYCAYVGGDNSAELVAEGITWLLTNILDSFIIIADTVTIPKEFTPIESAEQSVKTTPYLEDLKGWLKDNPDLAQELAKKWNDKGTEGNEVNLNGIRHFESEPDEVLSQEDWLQGFWDLWKVD